MILLLLLAASAAAQFSNSILDEPEVNCQPHEVGLRFRTSAPFNGHVFVRGHYNEEDCHRDYVLNDSPNGVLSVAFDKCGMRRKRSANPRGMGMTATVVVSFHRTFITSQDRAYHIECFYMETDKVVTQSLDVSMMTPAVIANDPLPMPDCQYRVLSGGPLGQAVSFAKVGDRVYHDWHCIYPNQNMYCMVIHTCTVDDGEASIYEVVDKDGCPRDTTVIGPLSYSGDLRAGTDSNVFKFADKARVYFTCQVRLSLKREEAGAVCARPNCGAFGRRKRSVARGADFDLVAPPILIADIDEPQPPRAWSKPGGRAAEVGVCLSELSIAIVLALVGMVAVIAVLTTLVFCLRTRPWKS